MERRASGDHVDSGKRIFKPVETPNRLFREKEKRYLHAVTELVFALADICFKLISYLEERIIKS
jgi:hypothetical protein